MHLSFLHLRLAVFLNEMCNICKPSHCFLYLQWVWSLVVPSGFDSIPQPSHHALIPALWPIWGVWQWASPLALWFFRTMNSVCRNSPCSGSSSVSTHSLSSVESSGTFLLTVSWTSSYPHLHEAQSVYAKWQATSFNSCKGHEWETNAKYLTAVLLQFCSLC